MIRKIEPKKMDEAHSLAIEIFKALFLTLLLAFSILLFDSSDVPAKMYKWMDENGQLHWSDTPPTPEENVKDVEEHKTVEDKQKEKALQDNPNGKAISKERRYGRKNEFFHD